MTSRSVPTGTIPLRFGTDRQFEVVRRTLESLGFTEDTVCQRLEIPSIYHLRTLEDGRTAAATMAQPVDALVRLFLDGERVDQSAVEQWLTPDHVAELQTLGLIKHDDRGPPAWFATVMLYPTEGLYIVSDLPRGPAGTGETMPDDVVYPAIIQNTQHFLSGLPPTPCDALLELCAGTGVAALIGSRYATRVWATDITERSTVFAAFNAALNGIANVEAVRGDLYEAVGDATFDRIVAHPPYMPAKETRYVYRDAGADGEEVTRRIIAELPRHLRPGGRLYCTCTLTDRREGPVETRVRAMLGEEAGAFDVAVITMKVFSPEEFVATQLESGQVGPAELEGPLTVFRELGVERLVYCTVVVQRVSEPRPTFTVRRQRGGMTTALAIDWLLRWEQAAAESDLHSLILGARLRTGAEVRLRAVNRLRERDWVPSEMALATAYPFPLEGRCEAWTPLLLARCDGRTTAGDLLDRLQDEGLLPREVTREQFAGLIRSMVAGGFVEIDEFPLPAAAPGPIS